MTFVQKKKRKIIIIKKNINYDNNNNNHHSHIFFSFFKIVVMPTNTFKSQIKLNVNVFCVVIVVVNKLNIHNWHYAGAPLSIHPPQETFTEAHARNQTKSSAVIEANHN